VNSSKIALPVSQKPFHPPTKSLAKSLYLRVVSCRPCRCALERSPTLS
jgi:hypothetical protein